MSIFAVMMFVAPRAVASAVPDSDVNGVKNFLECVARALSKCWRRLSPGTLRTTHTNIILFCSAIKCGLRKVVGAVYLCVSIFISY
jgi:hypothetical protein